jgi:dipeptidyl aminopeptidase/acylaminoacyl peptidase
MTESNHIVSPPTRVPVTPGALTNMRTPDDVQIAPDGKRFAFVAWQRVPDDQLRTGRIWIGETSGGEPRPLTHGIGIETCPRWSPDGQQLAFISNIKGDSASKPQLYLVPAHGGEPTQICTMPNGVSNLAWAPDGSRIAFTSLEGKEPPTDPLVVTPGRNRRLWTVRPGNDIPEAVTPDRVSIWEYSWSPDSQQIALFYAPGPEENDWFRGQVGVVAAGGGAIQQVAQLPYPASAITWSPDSSRLAFVAAEWSDPGFCAGDLFTLSLASGEIRNLTPNARFSPSWCRWFPDGRSLLFTCWKGVTHQVGILDEADGSITLLEQDFVIGGGWWPHLSTTPDLQSFVTVHSDAQHPSDVWFGSIAGVHTQGTLGVDTSYSAIVWTRLTHLNPIHEETLALAPSERISYASFDGCRIDAILTLPPTHEGDGPPPLIVDVHGGPSSAWSDGFSGFLTQMLVSAGYAVLQPNVRGSWGQGVAFADAVVGDMGGKDFQDMMSGVDYLVQSGRVDGNRVGIVGWSYGGYMAAWAVTQTSRFKAALMGAGISDWHNYHAQSSLRDSDVRFLATNYLEHPEIYRKHSPITYADRVTTPTLILHGENDPAVPIAQAWAFYRALCERNVPVEFVIYPREGHGLRERDHVRDAEERVLHWLKKYV